MNKTKEMEAMLEFVDGEKEAAYQAYLNGDNPDFFEMYPECGDWPHLVDDSQGEDNLSAA